MGTKLDYVKNFHQPSVLHLQRRNDEVNFQTIRPIRLNRRYPFAYQYFCGSNVVFPATGSYQISHISLFLCFSYFPSRILIRNAVPLSLSNADFYKEGVPDWEQNTNSFYSSFVKGNLSQIFGFILYSNYLAFKLVYSSPFVPLSRSLQRFLSSFPSFYNGKGTTFSTKLRNNTEFFHFHN